MLKSPGVWSHFAGAKRYNEIATNCLGIGDFEGEWDETSKDFSSPTTDILLSLVVSGFSAGGVVLATQADQNKGAGSRGVFWCFFSVKIFGITPIIQVWADAIDLSGRGSSTSRPRRVVFHYTDVPWQPIF